MSLHDIVWRAGAPVRVALIAVIHLYRTVLSGWLGGQCRFHPTCSHYAESAIREHGAIKGAGLSMWRIARCNPYSRGGIDPVPGTERRSPQHDPQVQTQYDVVLHPPEEAHA